MCSPTAEKKVIKVSWGGGMGMWERFDLNDEEDKRGENLPKAAGSRILNRD